MTAILPIMTNMNSAYLVQGNATLPAKQAFSTQDDVSFSSNKKDKKESHAGWWVLGGLAVVAALGVIFRKNISKAWKDGKFEGSIDNLAKNAEKKDVCKFDDIVAYMKANYKGKDDMEKALIYRIDGTKHDLPHKDAVLLGYIRKGTKNLVMTKVISTAKFDKKLLDALGDKGLVVVT